jgi:hypothetical protein
VALRRSERLSERAFAVLRVDLVDDETVPWPDRITVKSVERTQAIAEFEVHRLSQLNINKGCLYFWQATKLGAPDETK